MQNKIKLLLVEDSEDDAQFVIRSLRHNPLSKFEIDHVTTVNAGVQALKGKTYDLALLDLHLPDSAGIETYHLIRKASDSLPVVILSGYSDHRLAELAVAEGAQEYLQKDSLDANNMTNCIHYSIERQKLLEKLKQANQFKNDFLARMSHEIRTPMNGVIGLTNVLLKTELNDEQRELMEMIKKSGENLITIISDILDLSKIEAGKLQLEAKVFNLREAVDDCVGLFSFKSHQRKILIGSLFEPNVPAWVIGDSCRFRQILVNLLGNAIKFTESGMVLCKANILERSGNRAKLRFSVQDTGIGIEKVDSSKLFKPFSQLTQLVSGEVKGTGLGLAICQTLCEKMEGRVWYESQYGEGSTFHAEVCFEVLDKPFEPRHDLPNIKAAVLHGSDHFSQIVATYLNHRGVKDVTSIPFPKATPDALGNRYNLIILDGQVGPREEWRNLVQSLKLKSPECRTILMASSDHESNNITEELFDKTLRLPLRQADFYAAMAQMFGEQSKRRRPNLEVVDHAIDNVNILVCDDNVVNLKVAEKYVQILGGRCRLCSSGSEAIEAVKAKAYDLVFMDCFMPEMSGFETTKKIRATPNGDLPIIAVTAAAFEDDSKQCFEAGMNDFLVKPLEIEKVKTMIKKWYKKPQTGTKPTATRILDRDILKQLRSLNDNRSGKLFLDDLIDTFIEHGDVLIGKLENAVSAHDDRQVNALAHNFKGLSRNLGARHLEQICQEMERCAASEPLFNNLKEKFAEAKVALKSYWYSTGELSKKAH